MPDLARLKSRFSERMEDLRVREDQLALILSGIIGAVVGFVIVAFILLTGRVASHLYPPGGPGWGRVTAAARP